MYAAGAQSVKCAVCQFVTQAAVRSSCSFVQTRICKQDLVILVFGATVDDVSMQVVTLEGEGIQSGKSESSVCRVQRCAELISI
jgi:hypothetical protein